MIPIEANLNSFKKTGNCMNGKTSPTVKTAINPPVKATEYKNAN